MTHASSSEAWADVGDSWRDLGRRLADRYRTLATEDAGAAADRLKDTSRTLSDHLNRAVTSINDAAHDEETRASVDRAASTLGKAMAATFTEVGEEIQKLVDHASAARRRDEG